MSGPDVTPPRQRLSRKAAVWLTVGIAAAVILVIVVAIGLGSRGGPGTAGTTTSPTPDASSAEPEPEVVPTGPATPGAAVPAPTASAVPIDEPATPAPGVTVAVTGIEAVEGEAERPGDVAGPAVRFTMTVTNTTAQPVSLSTALVNVYYGADAAPAAELEEPGGSPLPQTVAAGGTAAGTFIFTIPEDERDAVLITLDYQVGSPVIAFEGPVPA